MLSPLQKEARIFALILKKVKRKHPFTSNHNQRVMTAHLMEKR